MNWIVKYLSSSIGRKQIMGASGVLIALWIFMHMVGNLPLLAGESARLAYNSYSWMLTHNKPVLYAMELVMTLALVLHFYMAITLTLENRRARPVGYGVNAKSGKRSFASFTMIYSGIWILVYLIFHLKNLKFGTHYDITVDRLVLAGFTIGLPEPIVIRDMWKTTVEEFAKLPYAIMYTVSMAVLCIHLVHAIGSAFQTLGLNHKRWNLLIKVVSVGYSVVVSLGFGAVAIALYIFGRTLS